MQQYAPAFAKNIFKIESPRTLLVTTLGHTPNWSLHCHTLPFHNNAEFKELNSIFAFWFSPWVASNTIRYFLCRSLFAALHIQIHMLNIWWKICGFCPRVSKPTCLHGCVFSFWCCLYRVLFVASKLVAKELPAINGLNRPFLKPNWSLYNCQSYLLGRRFTSIFNIPCVATSWRFFFFQRLIYGECFDVVVEFANCDACFCPTHVCAYWKALCFCSFFMASKGLRIPHFLPFCGSMWINNVCIIWETLFLCREPKPLQYAFNYCVHLCFFVIAKNLVVWFSCSLATLFVERWMTLWIWREFAMSIQPSARMRGLWLSVRVFGRRRAGFFCTSGWTRRCMWQG